MGNLRFSEVQEIPDERHEKTKQNKYHAVPENDDEKFEESEFLSNEKKIRNMEKTLNDLTMKKPKKPNPLASTYKDRKEYETNEELFNRNDQLRFSSLSMQLMGKTKKPIKDGGKCGIY